MMVATMAQLKKEGFKPKRSIILLLSGDEETSMTTTRALAAKYKGAEFALNGDGGGGLIAEDGKPQYYGLQAGERSEEHTSELQSLMRISYAVLCLKKKTQKNSKSKQETYNIPKKEPLTKTQHTQKKDNSNQTH